MHVDVSIDRSLIFAGEDVEARIVFRQSPTPRRASLATGVSTSTSAPASSPDPIHLLSGSAYIQSSFRLGESMNAERFERLQHVSSHPLPGVGNAGGHGGGLFDGVWGGLKQLVISRAAADEEEGYSIYTTPQFLLFTDIVLRDAPLEFAVTALLPELLPPTCRSQALTIQHRLVVSFQTLTRDGKPGASELVLPFRVFPCRSAGVDTDPYDLLQPLTSLVRTVKPTFSDDFDAYTERLLAGDKIATPEASGGPTPDNMAAARTSFQFAHEGATFATLTMARPFVHLGDTPFAVLDFAAPCFHVVISLELEESINGEFVAPNAAATSRKVYASQARTVLGLERIAVHLPVPFAATPTFSVKQVTQRWFLKLNMHLLRAEAASAFSHHNTKGWTATDSLTTDQVLTRVPLAVLAPDKGGSSVHRTWVFS